MSEIRVLWELKVSGRTMEEVVESALHTAREFGIENPSFLEVKPELETHSSDLPVVWVVEIDHRDRFEPPMEREETTGAIMPRRGRGWRSRSRDTGEND